MQALWSLLITFLLQLDFLDPQEMITLTNLPNQMITMTPPMMRTMVIRWVGGITHQHPATVIHELITQPIHDRRIVATPFEARHELFHFRLGPISLYLHLPGK